MTPGRFETGQPFYPPVGRTADRPGDTPSGRKACRAAGDTVKARVDTRDAGPTALFYSNLLKPKYADRTAVSTGDRRRRMDEHVIAAGQFLKPCLGHRIVAQTLIGW